MKTVKDYIPKSIPEFSPAGILVKGMTSPIRHKDRVDYTQLAAINYVKSLPISDYLLEEYDRDDLAAVLAWADHCGIGGPDFERTATATTRHPAFQNLGKGRKFASDGPAWLAAASELYKDYDILLRPLQVDLQFIDKYDDRSFSIPVNDLISLVESENWSLWNMAKEIFFIHTGLEGNPTNWPDKDDSELFDKIEEACQFINKLLVNEYDQSPEHDFEEN